MVASKLDADIKECVVTYELKADRSRGAVKGFNCYRTIRLGNVTASPSPSDDWEDCQ